MNILQLVNMLDAIESVPSEIKEEDKEFINDINNRLNGTDTLYISTADQDRLTKIHLYLFGNLP